MTDIMTEMMTETKRGLQVPESFVSVTGSGCLRLHLPLIHGAEIGVNVTNNRTMIGLQLPESFVSVSGSRCLRLHFPGLPEPVTVHGSRDDSCGGN